jgi:hypothetical protein
VEQAGDEGIDARNRRLTGDLASRRKSLPTPRPQLEAIVMQLAVAEFGALQADVSQLALAQARKSAVSFPAAKVSPELCGQNTKGRKQSTAAICAAAENGFNLKAHLTSPVGGTPVPSWGQGENDKPILTAVSHV